ncbi:hypothetical protein JCM5350_005769 [Sporobolomyces pararoseus]
MGRRKNVPGKQGTSAEELNAFFSSPPVPTQPKSIHTGREGRVQDVAVPLRSLPSVSATLHPREQLQPPQTPFTPTAQDDRSHVTVVNTPRREREKMVYERQSENRPGNGRKSFNQRSGAGVLPTCGDSATLCGVAACEVCNPGP